jgi:protein-L-isoaspartate(D-aspartate) O-methyltransferase
MTRRESAAVPKVLRLIMELRRGGIADARVLGALERVPRELFVPPTFADQAYENVALPIGCGQTVSQPLVVARMTEALEIGTRRKVLEIGTGSGYQTAVLAKLCRRVYSIERHRELWREAEQRLARLRIHNVTLRFGDGTKGWPEQSPFERIIVTAATPELPAVLADSLTIGGVLVAPVGEDRRDQQLLRIRRNESGFTTEELGAVRFVPLVVGLPRDGSGLPA